MTDWDAEGLLDGLEGAEREDRRALLETLSAEGGALEELRRAVAEGRLALVPLERRLLGERRHTMRDVAERMGRDVEWLRRYRRTLGLAVPDPDEPAFDDRDLEDAERGQALLAAGLDDEQVFDFERVLGQGMARYAEAFRAAFAEALLQPGDSELDVADRYAAAFEALEPLAGPHFAHVFFLHLREIVRSDVITAEERRLGTVSGRENTAVAFADLVGFTRLGASVGHEELGTVAGRLSDLASSTCAAPVRVVKTIGDAVMLVAPEPAPLVDAVLRMIEGEEGAGLPPLRAGVAYGPAVNRWGDWYGATVNRASRLTDRAREGTVLCDAPAHGAAPGAFDWSFAGEKRLKGIAARTRTYRARALGAAAPDPPQ